MMNADMIKQIASELVGPRDVVKVMPYQPGNGFRVTVEYALDSSVYLITRRNVPADASVQHVRELVNECIESNRFEAKEAAEGRNPLYKPGQE